MNCRPTAPNPREHKPGNPWCSCFGCQYARQSPVLVEKMRKEFQNATPEQLKRWAMAYKNERARRALGNK